MFFRNNLGGVWRTRHSLILSTKGNRWERDGKRKKNCARPGKEEIESFLNSQ